MNPPAISVLMPVYNGEKYLAEAVESILAQTFTDFEFTIVDDASTDGTAAMLADYARQDSRIRILTNETNSQIAFSLNRGLAAAQAPLIARMDADDWSHPERLEKQFAFMQQYPEVTVCGTWLEVYETGEVWQWPCDDAGIRAHLLFNSALAHPTVMLRREVVLRLTGGYDATKPPVEDYDLWTRLAEYVDVRFANLSERLLRYRIYPEEARATYRACQQRAATDIRRTQLQNLGLQPSAEDMARHLALGGRESSPTWQELYACWRWKRVLLMHNARRGIYDQLALRRVLRELWHGFILRHPRYRLWHSVCATYAPHAILRGYRSLRQAFNR